jgi:Putative beta-barrel porin 2
VYCRNQLVVSLWQKIGAGDDETMNGAAFHGFGAGVRRQALLVLALASTTLCAAVASPAAAQINPYAQTSNASGDNDDAPLRAPSAVPGLTGFQRGLQLGAFMSVRYEDNLLRQAIKDDGFRIRPLVSGSYGLGLGRGGLFVQGNYGRDIIYGSNRVAPSERMMIGGGLDFNLSRCTGQVGGSWRRGLSFITEVSQFGGFSQETATAGFAAQCRLGGAFSLNGSVLRSDVSSNRNATGGPASAAFDVQRWSYSAGVGFGNPTLGQFNLGGSISDSVMPGRLLLTPEGFVEDGLNQRSLRFGYSRQFGSKINVSAGVSYLDTQPTSTVNLIFIDGLPQLVDRPGFSGLGYDVALDFSFSPRLGMAFTAGRNTSANGVAGAQFVVSNSLAAQIDYRLGSRYTVAAGVNLRDSQYRGAFVSPLDPFRRQSDDFVRIFTQFSGRLGERLRFSVDVAHNRRRSNPAILNFNSTGVGLSLGYQLGRGS